MDLRQRTLDLETCFILDLKNNSPPSGGLLL
jgi:hypothetical protein